MLCKGGILVISRHFDWLYEILLVLLWWAHPGQQPSTHTAAHPFFPSPQWDSKENRNNKSEKTCGSKQKQFNRWRKKMQCQVMQRPSLTSSHKKTDAKSVATFKQSPLLCIPPQLLLLSTAPYGTDHPFGHFRSAVPSQLPAHALPTCWGTELGKSKSLDAVQAGFSSSQNTGVLPSLF